MVSYWWAGIPGSRPPNHFVLEYKDFTDAMPKEMTWMLRMLEESRKGAVASSKDLRQDLRRDSNYTVTIP